MTRRDRSSWARKCMCDPDGTARAKEARDDETMNWWWGRRWLFMRLTWHVDAYNSSLANYCSLASTSVHTIRPRPRFAALVEILACFVAGACSARYHYFFLKNGPLLFLWTYFLRSKKINLNNDETLYSTTNLDILISRFVVLCNILLLFRLVFLE